MTKAIKGFIEFHGIAGSDLCGIMHRACELAVAWDERRMPRSLEGRQIGLIVDDSGWRNTTAFDLGIQAMGGLCVHAPVGFGGSEETGDLAGYLGNWFDLLVIRTRELATLRSLAAISTVPIVNARTRSNHPCETLGDLSYALARRGSIKGLKIVGVSPDSNILRSWVEASLALPVEVVQVYPAEWHVTDAALLNPKFRASTDMGELLDADIVITDSWPANAAPDGLIGYQIGSDLLDRMRDDAIFLPCPPVARGQEVTAQAMEHRLCQSRVAKAYLLHAQNSLLEWIVT